MSDILNDSERMEQRRRQREFYLILAIIPVIILLTYIESHISIISGDIPVATNIFVLGLININILLLVFLIFLILRNAVKFFLESRLKLFGSKLRNRLITAFVGLTIVPTFLLFFVVIGLINKSIDSWFDIGVENSLRESLELAKNYYGETSERMIGGAWYLSRTFSGVTVLEPTEKLSATVEDAVDMQGVSTIEVYTLAGERVAYAVADSVNLTMVPDVAIDEIAITAVKGARSVVETHRVSDVVRGMVPVFSPDGEDVLGIVSVSYYVPRSMVLKMKEISATFEGYKQLKILENPVKTSYFTILLVITLLIVFFAIWIGNNLARKITVPILELAEGTHAVASGNLDYKISIDSKDEIGELVKSFNRMTEDIKAGKAGLESANLTLRNINAELEERRRYIEIVLGNIPAGVLSIDRGGIITSINKVGADMLGINKTSTVERNYKEVLRRDDRDFIKEMIREMNELGSETLERQMRVTMKDATITVLVNLNAMRDEDGEYLGMVAVLDDLTHLLKTQRMLAWKEVARRIAHEIKNPLTPIRLSAQRLRKKYSDRFPEDEKVFDDCTRTIINQVDELKTLVNEFSSFARMATANPAPNDLNEVVSETLAFYKPAHKKLGFNANLDSGLPVVEFDRDQLKRVLINLIDNSIDSLKDVEGGVITVGTGFDKGLNIVRIEVADNGCGISAEDKEHLFEPYFSTKPSGTGLGLAIVSNIISDHNGYIRVKDNEGGGTRFLIELPLKAGI